MSKTFYINTSVETPTAEDEAENIRAVLAIVGAPTWDTPESIREAIRDEYKGKTTTFRVTVEFEEVA